MLNNKSDKSCRTCKHSRKWEKAKENCFVCALRATFVILCNFLSSRMLINFIQILTLFSPRCMRNHKRKAMIRDENRWWWCMDFYAKARCVDDTESRRIPPRSLSLVVVMWDDDEFFFKLTRFLTFWLDLLKTRDRAKRKKLNQSHMVPVLYLFLHFLSFGFFQLLVFRDFIDPDITSALNLSVFLSLQFTLSMYSLWPLCVQPLRIMWWSARESELEETQKIIEQYFCNWN